MEPEEEAVAGMQVKESGSHLLFGEVVVQGKRRKLGPLAEDTCGKQVTRQCQKARSHSPEDCNNSLGCTTRLPGEQRPMGMGCQEAGPTEWPKLSERERKKNNPKNYAVNRKPWQLGTT